MSSMITRSLMSTFTPAPACLTDHYMYGDARTYFFQLGPPIAASSTACFPSDWSPTATFSPGLCPSGYTQACSSLAFAATVTETRATCCPTGYGCYTTGPPWFLGELCTSRIAVAGTLIIQSAGATGFTPTSTPVTPGDGSNAYGVVIRYQSNDFASATSSSTTLSTFTSSSATLTSTTSSATATAPADTGLSMAAAGGIGAAVGVMVLLLFGFGAFFFYRRGKRRARAAAAFANDDAHPNDKPPIVFGPPQEMEQPSHLYEMMQPVQLQEMYNSPPPVRAEVSRKQLRRKEVGRSRELTPEG